MVDLGRRAAEPWRMLDRLNCRAVGPERILQWSGCKAVGPIHRLEEPGHMAQVRILADHRQHLERWELGRSHLQLVAAARELYWY